MGARSSEARPCAREARADQTLFFIKKMRQNYCLNKLESISDVGNSAQKSSFEQDIKFNNVIKVQCLNFRWKNIKLQNIISSRYYLQM